MAVLYIKEQGTVIRKLGERILVEKGSETLLEVPVLHIENMALIGNVQITAQALHMLIERGIDISHFSYSGKYLGQTAADTSKNIFLRFEQYRFYLNIEKRMEMARLIVANKIENQITIIREHSWRGSDYEWKKDVRQMEKYVQELADKRTPNEILGIEGISSNIYFRAFGYMLKCEFPFQGRNRRPPKDPVNVLLSLAYTFLTKEVCSALEAESFEPYLGFLHGIRYGRKSLALDMMEGFRQPIVDRLVILLSNKRMIGKYDFDIPQDGHILLNEDGFKKFCTEYERWMCGRNTASGEKSFRRCIREQIAILKKAVSEKGQYQPYNWRKRHVPDKL